MQDGERQVAPDLSGIRADHRARYEWAAQQLPPDSRVIDLACGIGYGAKILADAGHAVLAVDRDAEALAYGAEHYDHAKVSRLLADASGFSPAKDAKYGAAVCFETIEHIEDPLPLLKALRKAVPLLLASVPNETVFPHHGKIAFHYRHYTPEQFEDLLNAAGWRVTEWLGQEGPESGVAPNVEGRTLIAVARRSSKPARLAFTPYKPRGPGHVVILGLGPSAEQYMDTTKRLGGRKALADEVWAINALGDVIQCDLVFHMDDIRTQLRRAAAAPQSNIAHMVKWLKTSKTPVITSRAHPDYPALEEFPLEDVINELGYAYFNGTAAYACAYAIYKGATKISFWGCDYTYANAHHAEQGRACLEFWIGFAAARGIELGFAESTSLMDTVDEPKDPNEIRVYGFDFDHVMVEAIDGKAKITLKPRETAPTAAEFEAIYDHSRHPNPLLRG